MLRTEYFQLLQSLTNLAQTKSRLTVVSRKAKEEIPYSAKRWRGKTLANLAIVHRKFSHPNIVNTLKSNGKPIQFAKVLPSNYTSRVISPKFHPANILRYTVLCKGFSMNAREYFTRTNPC